MAQEMSPATEESSPHPQAEEKATLSLLDFAVAFAEHRRLLILAPISVGMVAWALTFLVQPVYTAKTLIIPPQQQQSSAATALQSLGALAGLAGNAVNVKNPADQYVALMQSVTVSNRIIDVFHLGSVYETQTKQEAREILSSNVRVSVGKKDGLIAVEVDDVNPKRAAEIANRYVDELRRVTNELAVTEAQQRRVFFEKQLVDTQGRLIAAQKALQNSSLNESLLKAEPKAAADTYALLKAQVTASEVRLMSLRATMSDAAPEVKLAKANLQALKYQLGKTEGINPAPSDAGYMDRYRDFKYQETLFELFAKQFELAKLDESREGALIQVVDVATPPELKSRPRRGFIAAASATMAWLALWLVLLLRKAFANLKTDRVSGRKMTRLSNALNK